MVKDGLKFAIPPFLVGLALLFLASFSTGRKVTLIVLGTILVVLGLFVLYFFRDPERVIPGEPGAVVSPADGHVVQIVDEANEGRAGQRISIFLSVFDVHVNRSPVAGRIAKVSYQPGKFYAAYRKDASQKNEQNVITVDTGSGEIVFKQIAGAIARRVLCWKQPGQTVARGERIGMIRFGSRVDIWLPAGSEILVRRGEKVAGGSSVLAKWNSAA
jgi:phosphatidylserine decarboxylase